MLHQTSSTYLDLKVRVAKVYRIHRQLLITGLLVLILFLIALYRDIYYDGGLSESRVNSKIAILYAGPTYHDEVSSSVACILHDLGYNVIVYVGNGVHVDNIIVPFTGKRMRDSSNFYGRCVNKYITIRTPMPIIANPAIIVFITYPMLTKGFKLDENAIELLTYVKENHYNTLPVVCITHHSNTFLLDVDFMQRYLHINQTIYMFLGEHVQRSSQLELDQDNAKKNHQIQYVMSHFYPVMPLKYIVDETTMKQLSTVRSYSRDDTMFAIQGHFGGSLHGRRKDPVGVIDCLRQIEKGMHVIGATPTDNALQMRNNNHTTHRHSRQRNLINATTSENVNIVRRLDDRHLRSGLVERRPLNIDLIGRQSGKIDLGVLPHGNIRLLSDLDSQSYFKAIASARYMITAIRDISYSISAATSSIPAALMTEIPIVTTKSFLHLYPCLRTASMHNRINSNDNECDSIHTAAELTDAEYQQAKEEIRHCNSVLWNHAKDTFGTVLSQYK